MIHGRLGLASRWLGCALAFVFGLVSCGSVLAGPGVIFPSDSAAEASCLQMRSNWYGGPANACESDCELTGSNSYLISLKNIQANGTCSLTGGYGSPDQPYISSVDYSSKSPDGAIYFFQFSDDPEPNQCSELSAFDTAAMGPAGGANGERVVCYQECVWDVFGGFYVGTFPSGYVYFTFEPLGYACTDEPEPGDPADGDDDPLDLPPEDGGVDPGPDPGDGSGNSSGGGTCFQPPACTGDSIQCNILFQTWSTRCAVVDMGDLFPEDLELDVDFSGVEDGLSDVVSTLDSGFDNLSDGISNVEQELDGIRGFLQNVFGTGQDVSGPIPGLGGLNTGDKVFDENSLDGSGFGLPRSCPAILTNSISFSFFGNQYSINFDLMCDLLELVGQILVVLSAFVGVRILLRSVQ